MTDYNNLKVFQQSQVNGLTKYLSAQLFNNFTDRNDDSIIDKAKAFGLEIDYCDFHSRGEKFIFTKPRKITAEQTKFGKTWLKDYFFKRDGKPRSGQRTEYISDAVLKIAKSVSRFEFIGVFGCANGFGSITHFIPIYRTYDRKGNYFDYAPIHWGQPLVSEASNE